ADRLRFSFDVQSLPVEQLGTLETRCRKIWDVRGRITEPVGGPLHLDIEQRIQTDLLDLACLWTELRVRGASGAGLEAARREAISVLEQAETLYGPSAV